MVTGRELFSDTECRFMVLGATVQAPESLSRSPRMTSLKDRVAGFCRTAGLRLNTDLGQHYLVDETALESIVASGKITPGELVVEIGAGIGVLTEELLKAGARVRAIEFDARIIPLLTAFVGAPKWEGKLDIVEGNALDVPFPDEPYKVIANIPYHITSPLLRHMFLESARGPSSVSLLIQREVAERICDPEDRGLLTVVVSLFGKASIVRHVPPSSFLPPPAVDSSVIHIDCFPEPLADGPTIDAVISLLKLGFGQKRKMLRNTLGSLPDGDALLASADIDPTRRPQTLTTAEWIALARARAASAGNS